jgi:hypothetical protein
MGTLKDPLKNHRQGIRKTIWLMCVLCFISQVKKELMYMLFPLPLLLMHVCVYVCLCVCMLMGICVCVCCLAGRMALVCVCSLAGRMALVCMYVRVCVSMGVCVCALVPAAMPWHVLFVCVFRLTPWYCLFVSVVRPWCVLIVVCQLVCLCVYVWMHACI